MLFVWLIRVSVGFARGVFAIFGSARGVFLAQHGACIFSRVTYSARVTLGFAWVQLLLHGLCNIFLFFEVGTLIFLSFQGCFDLRILVGLNWESY